MARSIVLLLLTSASAYAEQAVQVTASSLNVRSGPGTGYSILGVAGNAQRYVVVAASGGWNKIWWAGGTGWVYGVYTTPAGGTGAKVTAASLNVRSGPATSYSIVGSAGSGQVYVQIGTSGSWKKIWFGGSSRWVSGSYTVAVTLGSAPPPPPTGTGWSSSYLGITKDGSAIPRKGLSNGTLQATLGVSVEPYGILATYGGQTFVQGKVSWFGGPNDSGTAGETVALTGEWASSLNNPTNPSPSYLASHLEKYYYCAMRWNYSPNGTSWWKNQRVLVINPSNGKAVVVRPVDWGPNTNTGRIIDLSPRVMSDLGLTTDQQAILAFAPAGAMLGVK